MKLLFVSRSLPFHRLGGMEGVAWDLARALAERGHAVEILTTRCAKLPAESVQDGIRIRTLDVPSGRYSSAYWRRTAESFTRVYRDQVDLVMGIGAGAFSIARSGRTGGVPLVMQVHGTSYRELVSKLSVVQLVSWAKSVRNIYGLANDFAYRKFDTLVAIGPAVRAALEEAPTRWAVGGAPVVTIANGIDERRFGFDPAARQAVRERFGIGQQAPVLVSASRLHVQKGVAEGLAGFAEARKVPFRSPLHHRRRRAGDAAAQGIGGFARRGRRGPLRWLDPARAAAGDAERGRRFPLHLGPAGGAGTGAA